MFGYEWGTKQKRVKASKNDFSFIKTVSPILWSEHCHECGAPLCYSTCIKYRKRKDGRCQLFKDGISKIPGYGLNGYSVYARFEGWAKLEAVFRPYQINKNDVNKIERKSSTISPFFKCASFLLDHNKPIKKYLDYGPEYKERLSDKYNKRSSITPDALYINLTNPANEVSMIIETRNSKSINPYKKMFLLKSGINEIIIPYEELTMPRGIDGYISIVLNEDHELIFHALDFVTFTDEYKKSINKNNKDNHKKIKCVAWDLDNTLWNGILIEGEVSLNNNIVNIMKELDNRGIINSVISKNNKEEALKKLKEYGLIDLIVMPQINWNPKSVNISNLAKQMNIGIDTICFIDDNQFELAEVSNTHPDVLCLNVSNVNNLLSMDCFNVPVTEDSKRRRLTYKMKEKEQQELEEWDGNIYDFLKSCEIKATISKPKDNEIERCYELIQRTNQLNSSGRRLSLDEVKSYINSKDHACYTIKVSDKFGDYGIVGFSIFSIKDSTITDFVISCRVANKTIEQSFIQLIYKNYCLNKKLYMNYKKTNKNGPLFNIIKDLKMELIKNKNDLEVYSYSGYKNSLNIVDCIFNK